MNAALWQSSYLPLRRQSKIISIMEKEKQTQFFEEIKNWTLLGLTLL